MIGENESGGNKKIILEVVAKEASEDDKPKQGVKEKKEKQIVKDLLQRAGDECIDLENQKLESPDSCLEAADRASKALADLKTLEQGYVEGHAKAGSLKEKLEEIEKQARNKYLELMG